MNLLDEDQRTRLQAYHADGTAWIERLPDLVEAYTQRWRLTLGPTFRPGGDASWAARVTRADGSDATLKISLPDTAERDAVRLLRLVDGAGAVRLFDHDFSDHVSLLELCEPGTSAFEVPLEVAHGAAAEIFPPLWAMPTSQLPDLPLLCGVAAQRMELLRSRAERLADPLLRAGADLVAPVVTGDDSRCVLHGDANEANALLSRRGWLAIDPRPMIGDPSYDLAMWVMHRLIEVDDPVEHVVQLARRLDQDEERALPWVAFQTLLMCSWIQTSGEPCSLNAYQAAARSLLAHI